MKMFFKKKKRKFTELFIRVKHKDYGEGFIFAYREGYAYSIGVRFDNPPHPDIPA